MAVPKSCAQSYNNKASLTKIQNLSIKRERERDRMSIPVRSHGAIEHSRAPTNDTDNVIDDRELLVLLEDTAGVCVQLAGGIDTARDRTTLEDFVLHLSSSLITQSHEESQSQSQQESR
jgi:hypothetical protein